MLNSKRQTIGTLLMHSFLMLSILIIWFFSLAIYGAPYCEGIITNTSLVSSIVGGITAVFSHNSLSHISNNVLMMLCLTPILIRIMRPKDYLYLFFFGSIAIGLLTYSLDGRKMIHAHHIGVSGLIWAQTSYLLSSGYLLLKNRVLKWFDTVNYFFILIIAGTIAQGLFPGDRTVSWQMHLGGFIVGILFALLTAKVSTQHKRGSDD